MREIGERKKAAEKRKFYQKSSTLLFVSLVGKRETVKRPFEQVKRTNGPLDSMKKGVTAKED